MRLAKKIVAVALAAAMSLTMLTACGGGGGSSASSGSNSGSSKPSSSASSGNAGSTSTSNSGSSSGSTSASASGASSNSGSTSEGETIDYAKSRTVKFFQKLGTNYTLEIKMDVDADSENATAKFLISTNGNRTYTNLTAKDANGEQTVIYLTDKAQNKEWLVMPSEEEVEPGKYGVYFEMKYDSDSDGSSSVDDTKPEVGLKFTKETKGNYYIEHQIVTEGTEKLDVAYWYEGNSSQPKYIITEQTGQTTETVKLELSNVEYKARAAYMDFEEILSHYVNMTGMLPDEYQMPRTGWKVH